MVGEPAVFGILTVSDRAHSGNYEDESGPAILGFFEDAIALLMAIPLHPASNNSWQLCCVTPPIARWLSVAVEDNTRCRSSTPPTDTVGFVTDANIAPIPT